MFTGLVEEKGVLLSRRTVPTGVLLHVGTTCKGLSLGESVAVEGACLTVTRVTPEGFEADVSGETLARTTLGTLAVRAPVNLERSLTLSARLGGHLVSGHVDGVCTLTARVGEDGGGAASSLTFEFSPTLARFIAEKGSVAINGVSLTVNAARARTFDVTVIPHTAKVTSIGDLQIGQAVNLEVDLLARYVARLLDADSQAASGDGTALDRDAAWLARLKQSGML